MTHKKSKVITSPEHTHLLEHVHFLEERTTELECEVEILREVFTALLELDEEDEDEDEDEYDEEEDFFRPGCSCVWSENESC